MGLIIDRRASGVQTVDATPVALTPYVIPPNSVAVFTLEVWALALATGEAAFFRVVGGFKRAGSGDVAVITQSPNNPPAQALSEMLTTLDGDSKDVATWDAAVSLSGTDLVMTVQGEAGKTIEWNSFLSINQFAPLG